MNANSERVTTPSTRAAADSRSRRNTRKQRVTGAWQVVVSTRNHPPTILFYVLECLFARVLLMWRVLVIRALDVRVSRETATISPVQSMRKAGKQQTLLYIFQDSSGDRLMDYLPNYFNVDKNYLKRVKRKKTAAMTSFSMDMIHVPCIRKKMM